MTNLTVDEYGNMCWKNEQGLLHREDGPALITGGDTYWYINGQYHREDGPAVEYANGAKRWHNNGKVHREDGPAIEFSNGEKHWYLNDIRYTEEEYKFIQFMKGIKINV